MARSSELEPKEKGLRRRDVGRRGPGGLVFAERLVVDGSGELGGGKRHEQADRQKGEERGSANGIGWEVKSQA